SLKTSIKTITYLSDTGCLEIQGASLLAIVDAFSLFRLLHIMANPLSDLTLLLDVLMLDVLLI
ncbi:hypothetical protein, partial [Escherichia coli]|uniref:hypothetical protein n=1 Tax=Escherichia coli TaxID=562 RepID=UPI001BD3D2EA